MAQVTTRDVVLLGVATLTTSGTGNDIVVPQGFTGAIVTLDVQTVSGTSPTLNVYVQNKIGFPAAADTTGIAPTGTSYYDDLLSFAQVTTSTTRRVFRIVGGGNVEAAAANGSLSAGSARNGPIGSVWNLKWTVGGSASPTFVTQVTAQFIP